MDVVGVGALNLDMLYQVPSLKIGGRAFEPGGKELADERLFTQLQGELATKGKLIGRSGGGSAANTVTALAKMGYSTGFLGVVGKDEEGRFLLSSMPRVDVSHVKKYKRSGMCISLLAESDRSLCVSPNANDFFSFTEDDIGFLNASKFVHMSSFVADSALAMQKQLVELLDDGVYISFSPGELYARRGMKQLATILERTRILFLNDREVRLLTGLGAREGSRALLDAGPHVVACTMGERGSMITTRNAELEVLAKRTVVVDKTGAGDVYAAGFLAGYLDGASLEVCGQIASGAAALSIAAYGREGYPDERFLRKYARELG